MRAALHGEWTKLRTVPAPAALLLLTVALIVAGAPLAATGTDRVRAGLLGVQVAQAVVAIGAVQVLAGEYETGLSRVTWTALPRRLMAPAAKAIWLLVFVGGGALLSVGVTVLAGRLLAGGYPPVWSGPVLRAALGTVLYLCLIALLGLGVAAVVRHEAAAAGVVLGLLYLVPAVLRMFGDPDWQRALYRAAPSTAGLTVQSTVDLAALPIGPWAGLGVTALWAAGAAAAGAVLIGRRDVP